MLKLANSYLIDSAQPSNLNYAWNFGSLLAVFLGIQIVTGVTLAIYFKLNVAKAFKHINSSVVVLYKWIKIEYLELSIILVLRAVWNLGQILL